MPGSQLRVVHFDQEPGIDKLLQGNRVEAEHLAEQRRHGSSTAIAHEDPHSWTLLDQTSLLPGPARHE